MSETERKPRRNNFTRPGSNDYDPEREPLDDSRSSHEATSSSGSDKTEWIALAILLDGATRYCPRCDEERETETLLEDKEHAPRECEGRQTVLPATALKWTCFTCGYQGFGGILENRTIEEFLDVLDEVFEAIGTVPESTRRELRGEALSRKRRGVDDRANLSVLLSEL